MSIIADNIRTLRMQKGLSQEQLADDLGWSSRSKIGSWEESRSEPNIKGLIELSDYFKVTIDDLVRSRIKKTK